MTCSYADYKCICGLLCLYIFSLSLARSFASFLLLLIFVRLNLIVVYLSNLSKITRRQAQELFISKCPNNRFSGLIVPNMGNGQNFRLSEWSVVWSMYEIRADLACLKHNTEQRNVQSDMRVLFLLVIAAIRWVRFSTISILWSMFWVTPWFGRLISAFVHYRAPRRPAFFCGQEQRSYRNYFLSSSQA